MTNEEFQTLMKMPAVYPADILLIPDSENSIYREEVEESNAHGEYALYLSLPECSARLFKESRLPREMDLSVFHMKADFRVAFLVLQAETLQVRVVIPLCDEKSRLWLDQCVMRSCITFFIADQASSRYRRFDSVLILPDVERALDSVFRASTASASTP